MVKRLRRRPLTAKTGVRVPVGLPKKRAQVKPVHAFLVLPARKANHARTKSRAEPHLPYRASVRVRAQRELCANGASPPRGGQTRTTPARKAERSRTCPVGRRFAFERSENFAPTAQAPPVGGKREPRPHEKPSGAAPALSGVGSRSSAARTLRQRRKTPVGGKARTTPARKAERSRTCPIGRRFAFERSENFAPRAAVAARGANINFFLTLPRARRRGLLRRRSSCLRRARPPSAARPRGSRPSAARAKNSRPCR